MSKNNGELMPNKETKLQNKYPTQERYFQLQSRNQKQTVESNNSRLENNVGIIL